MPVLSKKIKKKVELDVTNAASGMPTRYSSRTILNFVAKEE